VTEIVLLTTPQCGLCEHAKSVLDELAIEYQLRVEYVELESAWGRELAPAGTFPFPPGLLIDGQPAAYGRLSERRLRREFETRGTVRHSPSAPPPATRGPDG
jgi:hypothetical protein